MNLYFCKKVERNKCTIFFSFQNSPNKNILMKYIDVILPLALGSALTYSVPEEWNDTIQIGMRVVVPLGSNKMHTGIVVLIHSNEPKIYKTREALYLLDEKPIIRFPQLKFWDWISKYYLSPLGDVYQAALPSGLKLQSETLVQLKTDFEDEIELDEREFSVVDALSEGTAKRVDELNQLLGVKNSMPLLKKLLEKGIIEIREELTEKYKPKTESYVDINKNFSSETTLKAAFEIVGRAKKQLNLLMDYIELSKFLSSKGKIEVSKKQLLAKSNISPAVLSELVNKGILELYKKKTDRLDNSELKTTAPFPLSDFQQKAFQEIQSAMRENEVVLLHGVTSSGKTEIYIHLINKFLEEKKQILFLVPEIALTTQLTARLKQIFGNKLGVYHSKYSDAERVEIWNNVLNNKSYEVIIGVRSSIFLPFRQLGLVIVDEEHETSYKQFDPSPRYHARNSAIVLAQMHGAKTLLGSATPSIESFHNAKTGKYGLVSINMRYQNIEMPKIEVANIKEAYRKKEMVGHFSPTLIDALKTALSNKEQVILFQNRRGYAPYLECTACSYVPKCKNCDVSLTVHKYLNKLTCHYCGYTENILESCPVCKTPSLTDRGFGTEKIEQEIVEMIPEARVFRMDLDTTRNKNSHQQIIQNFEDGKIDILVGTQMVTKGLDFEKVSVVGILNADNLLNFPDFRSHERAYQLMAQVSGRAGRKHKQGTVILQTSSPNHTIIEQTIANNFEQMYETQCEERKLFHYPPFFRLIKITLRHKDPKVVEKASRKLAEALHSIMGNRVIGPNIPLVARIQTYYIKEILIKLETGISLDRPKDIIQNESNSLLSQPTFKSVRISYDVDPM